MVLVLEAKIAGSFQIGVWATFPHRSGNPATVPGCLVKSEARLPRIHSKKEKVILFQ